ncbi:MAG: VWA domain-containing protein [Candidatus Aminicenantes bacterium]|nr:VWA domain-containing protein [Candidatus Aminicenantes bacterium]
MNSKKNIKNFVSMFLFVFLLISLSLLFSQQKTPEKKADVFQGPDPDAIYLKLRPGSYKITDAPKKYIFRARNNVIILMENFLRDYSPGDPSLPYQVFHIALPPEAVEQSLQVEVIPLAEKELPGEYRIAPAPPYLYDQRVPNEEEMRWELEMWGLGKKIKEGRNIFIYEKDAFHPLEYCQVKSSGQLRKWKVATVVYYPIRYNPVKSKLILAEEIDVKVSFDRDLAYLKKEKTKQLLRDDTFDERAKKLFLNYDRAKEGYFKHVRRKTTKKNPEEPNDPNYVIITTSDNFTNCSALGNIMGTPADNFCYHKQSQGYSVMVVAEHANYTVAETGGGYSFVDAVGGYEDVVGDVPNGRPEKIRQWLMDNYLALGIEYVLLIGDPDPDNAEDGDRVGNIPMQLTWPNPTTEHPTDVYYSDLTGDWNHDDDDFVGENIPFSGYNNLDPSVTENLFSARWEGFIEVAGTTDPLNVYVRGYTEGQTKIWVDSDNDGFDNADLMVDDANEHYITWYSQWRSLTNGTYPIRIEYKQSTGDAYFSCSLRNYGDEVTTVFKHETAPATYDDGLETDFFNNDTLTGAPVFEEVQTYIFIQYIASGDRGIGGVDLYPEVIIGRIPFYNEDVDGDGEPDYDILGSMLTKIINYENANIHEETWRRRVLISTPYMYDFDADLGRYTTADYDGGEFLMDTVAPPPLWEWYRIHEEDYPDVFPDAEVNGGCSYDETVNGWNNPGDPDDGRGVVMWRTHGSQTGASHVFEESRIPDLDPAKPSFVIQTTCLNGKPEATEQADGTLDYPLGYTLLRDCPAIATISSSRSSAGGVFDRTDVSCSYKNNPYLLYCFAKGIFDNIKVGEVVSHVREYDASSSWPGNILNYNLYGDPTVSLFGQAPRSNNDIVFLLDGSGSMLSEGKWDAAVDAAVLFYQLMKELRHSAFEDRYNSVVFRWPCSGTADDTTAVPPGSGLKDISVPLTLGTYTPYEPEYDFCTPIGEGLEMAVDQFVLDEEESFYSNKTILLLSDGKQNRGMDPLSVAIPEEIKVQVVGLGEDYIEPDLIRDIADNSGGDYRITPSPRVMEDFFLQILCNTSWKLQDITVIPSDEDGDGVNDTGTAAIDQDFAVFIIVWDDTSASLSFHLDPPGDGPNITPTSLAAYFPMEVTYHSPGAGETHAYYVCKNIPEALMADWHFVNINEGGTDVPIDNVLCKVIEDPRTIANFDIDNMDHFTGQPITLSAKITEDGKPVIGLTEVYAELTNSPALSPGNIMSENSPPPDYPSKPAAGADRTLRSHYLFGVMKTLGLKSLSRLGGPKVILHDDGINGDLRANDGIYTGLYDDTQVEGSYTFKFRARGENSQGKIFDRTETLSEYVKFAAHPDNSSIEVVATQVLEQEKIVKAAIKVTPKDKFGSYLGPFLGDKIKVWSSVGNFAPVYTDPKDGSYIYTLSYPVGTTPLISVAVGDVIVKDRQKVKPGGRDRVFSFSLHAGYTVPLGNFKSSYDSDYSTTVDIDYHFTPKLSIVGLFGYNRFKAGSSSVGDTYWINISANLKYEFSTNIFRPYVNGGVGYYIPKSGDSGIGGNLGCGVDYTFKPYLIFELGANYHVVFGEDVQFAVGSAGIIFRF